MGLAEMRARLLESIEVGPAIRHFRFEVEDRDQFSFVPGQWVSLQEEIDGKKVTRAYSLASLPDANRFEICLNRVEEGLFSPYLFRLQPGDAVPFKGPVGTFTLRSREREAIFVATGTGIVPFRSMLFQTGYLEAGPPACLISGARYSEGLLFQNEFTQLAEKYPNFHYLRTVTRPSADWRGASGRVQSLLWDRIGERRDLDVYVCGLAEMVDDVREQLKALGFDRKQIIHEKYD